VDDHEVICDDSVYAEFVSGKKLYREIFPELKKFHYE
jgi:hypothetical protein